MKVTSLEPLPNDRENFRRDRQRFIPQTSGCYALVSFDNEVLYVGMTSNLRVRFIAHLDDREKRQATAHGRAFFFYWLKCDELNKTERTWQNQSELEDGALPTFNRISSPVSD